MRRLLELMFVALCAFNVQAQSLPQDEDKEISFTRGRIGIDYSIPDFSTKRIDGSIIGDHLADMLTYLKSNYSHGTCHSRLLSIVREDNEFLISPKIKSFKIQRIKKEGNVITIDTAVKLTKNSENINSLDIPFVFEKGISQNRNVNHLFTYLSRAVEELL